MRLSSDILGKFYDEVASIIRNDEKFEPDKMNIIKADADISKVEYDEKKCKTYRIIKDWEKNLS